MKGEPFNCFRQKNLIWGEADELPRLFADVGGVYDNYPVLFLDHAEEVESSCSRIQCLGAVRERTLFQRLDDAWPYAIVPTQRISESEDENVSSPVHTNCTVRTCAEQEMHGS